MIKVSPSGLCGARRRRPAMTKLGSALIAALAFGLAVQAPAEANVPGQAEPLEFPALDARGVDQPTGASAFSSPSISIGDPGSGGLSYHQDFIGGGAGGASGDWRHSIIGGITASSTTAKVTLLSGVERFTVSGGVYTPQYATGSSLSYNAGTGVYTYTLRDGTVAQFDSELTSHETTYGAEDGLITSLTRPNGLKWEYHYDTAQVMVVSGPPTEPIITFEGPFYRLQSVTTNTGYQLHLEYETQSIGTIDGYDEWLNVTKVQLINNAVDYCAPLAAQCTGLTRDWPRLSITEPALNERRYTDVLGDATTFRTDSGGRVTRVTDPSGLQTLISYSGARVSSVSTGGLTWSYTYSDSSGVRTTTTTGPGGAATATLTETDLSTGLVVASEDAAGARTEYTHDADRRVTKIVFPEGNEVRYTYDTRGNVTSVTRHQKPGSGLPSVGPLTMTATYPLTCANPATCNQPTSTTDAAGHITTYTYFSHGGLDTVTAPEPAPGLDAPQTRVIYAAQTAYYKNSAGVIAAAPSSVTLPVERRSCRIGELSSCQNTANERRTLITYGSVGVANNLNVTQVQEQLGNGGLAAATQMTYTAFGDVATVDGPVAGSADTVHYRYDARRRLVGEIGPDPDGAGPRRHAASRTTYDAAGRVTAQEAGTVTGTTDTAWAAFTRLHRQTVAYDTLGRPEIARAYDSGSTILALAQYGYYATGTSTGRLECTALRMDPASYGALPASACALGTAGVHGPDRITRTTYDDVGRPLTVTEGHGTPAAGLSARYAYTANGQLDWLEDGEGNRTDYQYDRLDRLSEINYANVSGGGTNWGDDEVFTYDTAGRLSSRTTRSNQTFSYTYDALGRVTQVNAPSGTPGTSYTYDNFSNMLTASDGVMTITNTFDARGRLLSQASPNGTVSYQYDAAGRRTRMTWPDAFYVSYDYTVASQLTHIRENGAASGVGVLAAFAYDDLGRRTKLTRGNGTVTDYSYDAAGRLEELVQDLAGTANDNTDAFAYNPAGQITSRTRSNTGYSFASHINVDTLFTFNGLNEITSVTGEAAPSYDARGNMTAFAGKSYTFDQYNRLTSVSDGTNTTTLSYDPLGRLQVSDVGPVSSSGLYDGADAIAQYNDTTSAMIRRWVHGPGMDEPLVEYTGSGTANRTFLHADARGSIIAHTDSAGALTATLTYDEYGNPGPTNTGLYQYTGQMWIAQGGVYHYKNRAYHPGLGRFLQTDPIGHSGGINLYAYVGGDPVNMVDPWGLEAKEHEDLTGKCDIFRPVEPGSSHYECVNLIHLYSLSINNHPPEGALGRGGGNVSNKQPKANEDEDINCDSGIVAEAIQAIEGLENLQHMQHGAFGSQSGQTSHYWAALILRRGTSYVFRTYRFNPSIDPRPSGARLGDRSTPWGPALNALGRSFTSFRGDPVALVVGNGRDGELSLRSSLEGFDGRIWLEAAQRAPLSGGLGVDQIFALNGDGRCEQLL